MEKRTGDHLIDTPKNPEQLLPSKVCGHCAGTGMVCGNAPVIDSENCCADYANTVCPTCRGTGTIKREG